MTETPTTIARARTILRDMRAAATPESPGPWEVVKDRYGNIDIHDAQGFQIRTDGFYAEGPGEIGPAAATLIVVLAGNPAFLDAIDGMLAVFEPDSFYRTFGRLEAERIASAIVEQAERMGLWARGWRTRSGLPRRSWCGPS